MMIARVFPVLLAAACCHLPGASAAEGPSTAELDAAAQAAIAGTHIGGHRISLQPTRLRAPLPRPVPTPVYTSLPAGAPLALRIDCGMSLDAGWQYRDPEGRIWLADQVWQDGAQWGAEGGQVLLHKPKEVPLPGSHLLESMYRSERRGMTSYRFTLPPGTYRVLLHFMELQRDDPAADGQRAFAVEVNGETLLTEFDPLAAAEGKGEPVVQTLEAVDCPDGQLRIGFGAMFAQLASINGIEIIGTEPLAEPFQLERGIVPISPAAASVPDDPGPVVGRFLCGAAPVSLAGYELSVGGGIWWPAGAGAKHGFWAEGGGVHQANDSRLLQNTTMPQVYRHSRFGGGGWQIQLPDEGPYIVRCHFIQNREYAGRQSFDLLIEDQVVLQDIDPTRDGGGVAHPSIVEVRDVRVVDGQLSIDYDEHHGEASISGIEVFRQTDAPDGPQAELIFGPAEREPLRPTPAQGEPLRVLFVGNSHTFFWDMPRTVAAQVNNQPGSTVFIQPYWFLHGGKTIGFFAGNKPGGKRPSVESVMRAGAYDAVVLQLTSSGYSASRKMIDCVKEYAAIAAETDTRLVLYVFYPLETLDGFTLRDLKIIAERHDMIIVPFGDVHRAFYDQAPQSGLAFDREGVGPHLGFHPAYVNACTHSIAWTGLAPVDHPVPALCGSDLWVQPAHAAFIQGVASDAWQRVVEEHGLSSYASSAAAVSAD